MRKAKYVRATTPAGTNIFAELNPSYKWFKTSGIISHGEVGEICRAVSASRLRAR